jgi:lysophospholipase L1-like esterase
MNFYRSIGMAAVLAITSATCVAAQDPQQPPATAGAWQDAIDRFAAADRLKTPPAGAVLFIGSSSIRLWSRLESGFREAPIVIKRGFGGARLTDCVRFMDRLVVQYRPRQVLLYAGDNDLAEGSTPREILERVEAFTEGVQRRLPQTQIAFIAIKPSPARQHLLPAVRRANALVEAYASTHAGVDYIDVFTPMLTPDGSPRPELFREDALHLNEAGYALWRSIIQPHLLPDAGAAEAHASCGRTSC